MTWQTIDSAPKGKSVWLYGYRTQGQSAPGGPYKYYYMTIGSYEGPYDIYDEMQPGCGCVRPREMEAATHWMPLPEPPK